MAKQAQAASAAQRDCPIPCEELVLLATALGVSLSHGKTAAETELLSQFFNVVSTSLGALAICKATNDDQRLVVVEES